MNITEDCRSYEPDENCSDTNPSTAKTTFPFVSLTIR
jgi:hypothetical protein